MAISGRGKCRLLSWWLPASGDDGLDDSLLLDSLPASYSPFELYILLWEDVLVLQEFEFTIFLEIFSVYCVISLWEGVSVLEVEASLWLSCWSEWLLIGDAGPSGLLESLLEASSSLLDPVPVSENISLWEGVLVL